jgi:hypothetical protein
VVTSAGNPIAAGPRAWSLLALGDSRQFAGNDGYDDLLARHYSFDSTVPNCGNVMRSDLAVLRDSDGLIGAGWIEQIDEQPGKKLRRRCPVCRTTALKQRVEKRPRYRCDHGHEFGDASEETLAVIRYRAYYATTWVPLTGLLSTAELAPLYRSRAQQHAIRELDISGFRDALEAEGKLEQQGWWDGLL